MVVILTMSIWIDLLVSFSPWILLLGEVYLGKRVYDATRRKSLLRQKILQLRLLTSSLRQSSRRGHASDSTSQGVSDGSSQNLALLTMLSDQMPAIPSVVWERLASVAVTASVFVLAFCGMSFLFRPFANRAMLSVLPLCLPLGIIPLPYLLGMKPRPTLLVLATVLGFSFLTLFLIGV